MQRAGFDKPGGYDVLSDGVDEQGGFDVNLLFGWGLFFRAEDDIYRNHKLI
jgi:hypothetical protein